jgi:hypothetical protein
MTSTVPSKTKAIRIEAPGIKLALMGYRFHGPSGRGCAQITELVSILIWSLRSQGAPSSGSKIDLADADLPNGAQITELSFHLQHSVRAWR